MDDEVRLKKGDAVTVKFATHEGFIKHSATVLFWTEESLVVSFASGLRYRVPHGENRYERVCNA